MAPQLYLGWDVGGTKCTAILGNGKGEILERVEWPSEAVRGPDAMIQDFLGHVSKIRQGCPGIVAAGVAMGGPLDAEQGIIRSPPNLPGWKDVPLKQMLQEILGIPVFVEHDATACALAEHRWGEGRNARRLVYLTCGTGLGAGFIFDGRIYRGASGHASDIGHVRYARDGPEAYGKLGSVEAYCSGSGIRKLAAWKFPGRWGKMIPAVKELAELASCGDTEACEILAIHAEALGDVCALLSDILYPDLILLGSLARYLGEDWMRQVRARFEAEAHPDARRLCAIREAGLGKRLQDCSALVVALQAGA